MASRNSNDEGSAPSQRWRAPRQQSAAVVLRRLHKAVAARAEDMFAAMVEE
jgi:hypothetical protein